MITLQINVDDILKQEADDLFSSLGLDIQTAVRIFLKASIENSGIPFYVQHRHLTSQSLTQAVNDVRNRKNLYGPYKTAEEAVASMLKN